MTHTLLWEPAATQEFRALRLIDPIGAKACVAAISGLADEPRPPEARPLGGSGYYRLRVGTWRVLYRPDDRTVTVYVVKVGRAG
ncbi:type II toxin-antitoxin system RelE/ParE family toxin [Streptomyces sp. NPDC004609]|uniref:type II toxin-antitoxin system RelE family toxin n=1 Tax=Streptomyces sp. NPDC004609 TaxID=3364704 RepID=UPI0036AF86C4